jgi:hypothetical protein
MLPTTLQMAMLLAPWRLASRSAARVSAGERVPADHRMAVPVLGAVVDLDRHARQLLDHELAHEPGVP